MADEVIQESHGEENLDEQENQEGETSSEEQQEESVSEQTEESLEEGEKLYSKADLERIVNKKRRQLDRKYQRELDLLEKDISPRTAYNYPPQIETPVAPQDEMELRIQVALQKQKQLEEQNRTAEKQRTEQQKLQRKIDDAQYKYDDYEDVLTDTLHDGAWTQEMEQASHLTDNAPEFAYKAAKFHRKDLQRISKLSPAQQITEMILLADRIKNKAQPKKVSAAPEPIKKIVSNSGGTAQKSIKNMSFEERVQMLRKRSRR